MSELLDCSMQFYNKGDWASLPEDNKPFRVLSDCWMVEWIVRVDDEQRKSAELTNLAKHYRQFFLDKAKAEEVYAGLLLGRIPDDTCIDEEIK